MENLKTLNMRQVVEATGIPERTIWRLLAEDRANKTPGKNFATPMRIQTGTSRRSTLRWRASKILEWMEKQEKREAR